jgi:pullulanase/glycogen debranching enzyme
MSTEAVHRSRFFTEGEILSLRPDGGRMASEDWNDPVAHAVAITASGGRVTLLINAWWDPLTFRLTAEASGASVFLLVDTAGEGAATRDLGAVEEVVVVRRSLMLLGRSSGRP